MGGCVHEDDEIISQEVAGKMVANVSVSIVRIMIRHSRLCWLTQGDTVAERCRVKL